jgi:hypothetical protein
VSAAIACARRLRTRRFATFAIEAAPPGHTASQKFRTMNVRADRQPPRDAISCSL